MRLATVDVGTNTALMLVSEWEGDRLAVHHDETRYVRLGEGVDASGEISTAALARLRDALVHFRAVGGSYGVDRWIVTGTSASRDASNPEDLSRVAQDVLDTDYTILTGEQEAHVSFLGAVAGIHRLERDLHETHPERVIIRDRSHRATIIDVGGGSTEVVQGVIRGLDLRVERAVSMDIGSVRMTERFFSELPPAPDELRSARDFLSELLDRELGGFEPADVCIGSSGTAVVLAHLETGARNLEQVKHGCPKISRDALDGWAARLQTMSEADVRSLDPDLMEGRADVFGAAVTILQQVVARTATGAMAVSSQGVRHGVAIRYFRENDV